MRNKAILSYYLFEANSYINSLLYIKEIQDFKLNFDLENYTNERIILFYKKLRHATELLENKFGISKKDLKQNEIFNKIFYEIDKNIVHKDDSYVFIPMNLEEKIQQAKEHLNYVYQFVKSKEYVLKYFNIQYRVFDSLLFRIVNPNINIRFINQERMYYESDGNETEVKEFNQPELLKDKEFKNKVYGIKISSGITPEEKELNFEKALLLEQIKWGVDLSEYLVEETINENKRNKN